MASLRDEMPTVAAWIDDLRAAFGAEAVTAWVRQGLADGSFHAGENGHEVGVPIPAPANAISLADMVIAVPDEPKVRRR